MAQMELFDVDRRLSVLSAKGHLLEAISKLVWSRRPETMLAAGSSRSSFARDNAQRALLAVLLAGRPMPM